MSQKTVDEFGREYWLCDGEERWYRHGKLHREDGPAIVNKNGTKVWYRGGKIHRDNGPAVVWLNGTLSWYRDDVLHREDGPAVVHKNGGEEWYRNGEYHREDGPAFVHVSGARMWYRNGARHRLDGPAVIWADGDTDNWFLHDENVPDLNIVSTRIQRWYRMRKIRKFVGLINTEGPFSHWFDSPDGWGGKWRKRDLQKFANRIEI